MESGGVSEKNALWYDLLKFKYGLLARKVLRHDGPMTRRQDSNWWKDILLLLLQKSASASSLEEGQKKAINKLQKSGPHQRSMCSDGNHYQRSMCSDGNHYS